MPGPIEPIDDKKITIAKLTDRTEHAPLMSVPAAALSLHVLLVEDSEPMRELIAFTLKNAGCRVDTADRAETAIKSFLELRPQVIVMDLGLPGLDGWEAIRLIRDRARSAEPAYSPWVIAHSAFDDADARSRAFAAGCNEFVTKEDSVLGAIRGYARRTNRLA